MEDRFLGILEGDTWAEVGYKVAQLTAPWREIPFQRVSKRAQRRRDGLGGGEHWEAIARSAAEAVDSHGEQLATSKAFLQGAAEACGFEMWQLFTLYELESASLVNPFGDDGGQEMPKPDMPEQSAKGPHHVRTSTWRKARRTAVDAAAEGSALTGCTGLGCSSGLLGQTEEVDVSVYDYGKKDVVYRLRCRESSQRQSTALVYDPACTFCPIGLGRSAVGVTRFALYPSHSHFENSEKYAEGGLPLAAILWELLLGDRSLEDCVRFLQSLFKDPAAATMAAGASLMLGQAGRGVVVVEWSRSQLWVSPIVDEGALVTRANHSLSTSSLRDSLSVQNVLDESRVRQDSVDQFIAEELLAGRAPPLSPHQLHAALSRPRVQNDQVLATVVVCPGEQELHVRFRLQTQAMQLVEQTVERNLWLRFSNADVNSNRKKRWASKA